MARTSMLPSAWIALAAGLGSSTLTSPAWATPAAATSPQAPAATTPQAAPVPPVPDAPRSAQENAALPDGMATATGPDGVGASAPAVSSPPRPGCPACKGKAGGCAACRGGRGPADFRLHVGAHLGLSFPFGATAIATWMAPSGRPRFEADFTWEPSNYLQSYSVGGAYHIADRMFFVGARLRLVQLHAPWSRGYEAAFDNHLGLGLEAGLRAPVGPEGKLLVLLALGGSWLPTAGPSSSGLITLNAGLAWGVYTHARTVRPRID